jgi:hypothetical protein
MSDMLLLGNNHDLSMIECKLFEDMRTNISPNQDAALSAVRLHQPEFPTSYFLLAIFLHSRIPVQRSERR